MTPHPPKATLLKRQAALLALLDDFGGQCTRLDFHKRLFLFCQERDDTAPYEFVPHRFGAYSFTSDADRRRLTERGLLAADVSGWQLTEPGRALLAAQADQRLRTDAAGFAQRWRQPTGDALVAETYRRYPYYAIRSEIAARVLAGDTAAHERIDAERPPASRPGLATIGYEGRSLERYLNILLLDGVTLLCDVRRNPLSRKFGFSKRALAAACKALDIRYAHLPELGIPSAERRDLRTQADYDALFARYEREHLPTQGAALARVRQWIDSGERVALTCYEESPLQCHRLTVANAVSFRGSDGVPCRHL
jgi:hypothetical protein